MRWRYRPTLPLSLCLRSLCLPEREYKWVGLLLRLDSQVEHCKCNCLIEYQSINLAPVFPCCHEREAPNSAGVNPMNNRQLYVDDSLYHIDGRYLIRPKGINGDEYFRKAFDHAEYETLKNLSIESIALAPGGSDIVVLLEIPRAGYKRDGNLLCVSEDGDILWWAELTDTGRDAYVELIVDSANITAQTWEGYLCVISPTTGRIQSRLFTK